MFDLWKRFALLIEMDWGQAWRVWVWRGERRIRCIGCLFPGRIKTLLLRRKNDWYGACFGMLLQPLRPAAAAAAIDEKDAAIKNRKLISFLLCHLLLRRSSTNLALIDRRNRRRRNKNWSFLLRHSFIAAHRSRKGSAAIRALFYGPAFFV